jgi:hypothetical protein
MSFTEVASCASARALEVKVAQTSKSVHRRRSAVARSAIRDDVLGMR